MCAGATPDLFGGYRVHVAVSDLTRVLPGTFYSNDFLRNRYLMIISLNNNLSSKRFKPPIFEESAIISRSDTFRGFHIIYPEFQRDIVVRTNITESYKLVA